MPLEPWGLILQMQPVMERFTDVDGFFRIFLFQKEAGRAKLTERDGEGDGQTGQIEQWPWGPDGPPLGRRSGHPVGISLGSLIGWMVEFSSQVTTSNVLFVWW